ncbi:MAG: hypothetical protein Q9190_005870 [Brigantiaea leucoxantha]
MARSKQAKPLQREPSDFSRGPPESPDYGWKQSIGNGIVSSNGKLKQSDGTGSNDKAEQPSPLNALEQPGLSQLVIGVTGIYISLNE